MRDMSKAKRQPKGIPAGGEFAGGAGRAEALDLVDDTVSDGLDRVDESDPAAVVGYLESLDPGVRFFLSDTARDLEARTIEDRDWCVAHAEELVRAAGAGDVSTVSLDGVARYWRPDDPEAADRLAAVAPDESAWRGYLCRTRAVSDGLFRERGPVAPATLLDNPHLTDRQRRALTVPLPDNPFTPAPDARTLEAMLMDSDDEYRGNALGRNYATVRAVPELERLVRSDPSPKVQGLVRTLLGPAPDRWDA